MSNIKVIYKHLKLSTLSINVENITPSKCVFQIILTSSNLPLLTNITNTVFYLSSKIWRNWEIKCKTMLSQLEIIVEARNASHYLIPT